MNSTLIVHKVQIRNVRFWIFLVGTYKKNSDCITLGLNARRELHKS